MKHESSPSVEQGERTAAPAERNGFSLERDDAGAIVIRIVAPTTAPPDALVRKDRSGVEAKAWKRLRDEGRLPVVRLGRYEFCKGSDLVALVDGLGAEQRSKRPAPKLVAVEPSDALDELATATRRRAAGAR